jgi:hypothetical protein
MGRALIRKPDFALDATRRPPLPAPRQQSRSTEDDLTLGDVAVYVLGALIALMLVPVIETVQKRAAYEISTLTPAPDRIDIPRSPEAP